MKKPPSKLSLLDPQQSSLVQRVPVKNEAVPEVPAIVHEVLQSPGQSLDSETRAFMEPRFGHDFSQVRVHTDAKAAESARAINALAYTLGQDIAFREGQYGSHSTDLGLLAHELTHVVQQSHQPAPFLQRRPPWLDESDDLEREAGRAERGVTRRRGSTLSYREAMQTLPPPRVRPAAARVQDTRERVLQGERRMFDVLRQFIVGLPTQLRQLASTGSPNEAWLTSSNPNVQSALRVLDLLASDLTNERFVVRFDQPAGTQVAASYDFANDSMHLQAFANASERTLVAIDLLHEYTHLLQDREAESIFARQTAPRAQTREEDLQREVGARREQVYFGEMLRVLGSPVPNAAIFGAQLSGMVFRGRFETERTAQTPAQRRAATREIRREIETPYQAQLQRNAGIKNYQIELDNNNHALLHWDLPRQSTPRDLGEPPPSFTTTDQLRGYLAHRVSSLPEFNTLFLRPGGQPFTTLLFAVVFNGEQITSFALEPNTP